MQLRGVSTHGLTWYPDYLNAELFGQIAEDWNCNLIRLAMYSEVYCGGEEVSVTVAGAVVGVRESRSGAARTHTVEILDFGGNETAYRQILYDRIPTLPQSLHRDFGVISHLWQNIAHRVARTGKR